jgi:DNA polymerase-4
MPVVHSRKIIHIDMDCFYAAIEIRDRPELEGEAVAVGGSRSRRGVITTCNYEARKFGIRSAMPSYLALQKCPHLILVPTRFDVYRRESARIREIFRAFTERVEPLSLDEAYLDVTEVPHPAAAVASEIRGRIYDTTALTASAGIGPNKLVAKIASDWKKPNGQFEVTAAALPSFMQQLPVRKIWGIGQVSAQKLERLGVTTCGQLQQFSQIDLHRLFGKFGLELFDLCRGIDHRPVEPHRERKSLSTERTFDNNLTSLAECETRLNDLYEELVADLERKREPATIRKLFLKLKFADFSRTTVERSGQQISIEQYQRLLEEAFRRQDLPVRLMGLGVRFATEAPPERQMELTISERA